MSAIEGIEKNDIRSETYQPYFTYLREVSDKFEQLLVSDPMVDEAGVLHAEWCEMTQDSRGYEQELKRIYFLKTSTAIGVKLWLGGKMRVILMNKFHRGASLLRFADMCAYHLWKYKLRGLRPMKDSDFSRSIAAIEWDIKEHPEYFNLVREVEHIALLNEWIKPLGTAKVSNKKTIFSEVKNIRTCVMAQLTVMDRVQRQIMAAIDEQDRTQTALHGETAKRLNDIESKLNKLEGLLIGLAGSHAAVPPAPLEITVTNTGTPLPPRSQLICQASTPPATLPGHQLD